MNLLSCPTAMVMLPVCHVGGYAKRHWCSMAKYGNTIRIFPVYFSGLVDVQSRKRYAGKLELVDGHVQYDNPKSGINTMLIHAQPLCIFKLCVSRGTVVPLK